MYCKRAMQNKNIYTFVTYRLATNGVMSKMNRKGQNRSQDANQKKVAFSNFYISSLVPGNESCMVYPRLHSYNIASSYQIVCICLISISIFCIHVLHIPTAFNLKCKMLNEKLRECHNQSLNTAHYRKDMNIHNK